MAGSFSYTWRKSWEALCFLSCWSTVSSWSNGPHLLLFKAIVRVFTTWVVSLLYLNKKTTSFPYMTLSSLHVLYGYVPNVSIKMLCHRRVIARQMRIPYAICTDRSFCFHPISSLRWMVHCGKARSLLKNQAPAHIKIGTTLVHYKVSNLNEIFLHEGLSLNSQKHHIVCSVNEVSSQKY